MLTCKCSQLFLCLKKRNNFFFNFFNCCIGKIYKIISFFYWQKKSSSCRTRSTKTSGSRIWKFRNFLKKNWDWLHKYYLGYLSTILTSTFFEPKLVRITDILPRYSGSMTPPPTNVGMTSGQTRPRVYPTAQLLWKYKTDVERYLFRFS